MGEHVTGGQRAGREPARIEGAAGEALAPVMPGERNPTLDILRGFALFGVLWSNLNHYSPTEPTTLLDYLLAWTQPRLIQNRLYSLLGLLFGIGFAIQLGRAEDRQRDIRGLFYRRMGVLLLFGVVHGMFIRSGDVLTRFALLGCLLPLYRRLAPRQLLVAAGATWFGAAYAEELVRQLMAPWPDPGLPDSTLLYATGTYLQVMPARVAEYLALYRGMFLHFGTQAVPFLTLFILGLWAERSGLVTDIGEQTGRIRRVFVVALACVAVGLVLDATRMAWWPAAGEMPSWGSPLSIARWVLGRDVPRLLMEWGEAVAYATALALLAQRARVRAALRPLAAAGRMSLTTYLTQTVISTSLFYGYGLGWLGHVSYSGMLALALVIFGGQLAFGTWWFRHYRFGPAEWLWRSLSYGKRQPMRLATER